MPLNKINVKAVHQTPPSFLRRAALNSTLRCHSILGLELPAKLQLKTNPAVPHNRKNLKSQSLKRVGRWKGGWETGRCPFVRLQRTALNVSDVGTFGFSNLENVFVHDGDNRTKCKTKLKTTQNTNNIHIFPNKN